MGPITRSGLLRLVWLGDGVVVVVEVGVKLGVILGLGLGVNLECDLGRIDEGEGVGEGEEDDLVKKEVIWRC